MNENTEASSACHGPHHTTTNNNHNQQQRQQQHTRPHTTTRPHHKTTQTNRNLESILGKAKVLGPERRCCEPMVHMTTSHVALNCLLSPPSGNNLTVQRFNCHGRKFRPYVVGIPLALRQLRSLVPWPKSRLSPCAREAADAVSAFTQSKWKMLQNIENSQIGVSDIWIRLPRHKWPKSWSNMKDPVVRLKRNLYGHPLAGLLWENNLRKSD